jgi:hypothetical protein
VDIEIPASGIWLLEEGGCDTEELTNVVGSATL